MMEYLRLSEVAARASMSPRTLKKHLHEITHYRATPTSPVLIRWADFVAWMDQRRVDAHADPDVTAILERIAEVA